MPPGPDGRYRFGTSAVRKYPGGGMAGWAEGLQVLWVVNIVYVL